MSDGSNSYKQDNKIIAKHQIDIDHAEGAVIGGNVDTGGGDFAGRDIIHGDQIQLRSQTEELGEYLAKAVAAYEARIVRKVYRGSQRPDVPYKSLYAFEVEDANIFFGRDAAGGALYETVLKHRLTIVYARSGAGKSSLLNAGLTPRLIQEGRLPVFARTYHDPVYALKQAIAPESGGPWPALLPTLSLQAFLGLVCKHLSKEYEELVVVLDQFEEFFVFWPESEREAFVSSLADCYEDDELPVRFVIALRKDYFADMDAFEKRIPLIFTKQFGLKAMSSEEAKAAVTEPVSHLQNNIKYEGKLLDALLDDLASGEIELPHLQLVCTQLFESLPADRNDILLADYEAFGRTAGVLGNYLKKTIDELPGRQTETAKNVLKALVSSESTKRVMSETDLAARISEPEEMLETALVKLINKRLLRRDEAAGEIVYELAHEVLIEEIRGWFEEADFQQKQAEEMLARAVANWRIDRAPIPAARLERLYEHRESFVDVDSDTATCLLMSVVAADGRARGWIKFFKQLGNPVFEILIKALKDDDLEVRRGAVGTLGALGDERAVGPLIAVLKNGNDGVRGAAAEALGQFGNMQAVEPLIAALTDEDGDVRGEVAEALGKLGDERAVEPLITTLKNRHLKTFTSVIPALISFGKTAVESLIVALTDEDRDVRGWAAYILGELGDERAVGPLIAVLKDEEWDSVQFAAEALGTLGDERSVEPLIAALEDEDWHVRKGAAHALGWLGDIRAVELLIAALKDGDWHVRHEAAGALGQLGDKRAVEPLLVALKDEDGDVREEVAEALGKLDDERAVEPLIAALRDENKYVRRDAARALGQLGNLQAIELLIVTLKDEDWYVREMAAQALGRLGDKRAVEPLLVTLKDEVSDVREEVAEALGRLGDKRAVEPLIAALRDENQYVRRAVEKSLKKLGWEGN